MIATMTKLSTGLLISICFLVLFFDCSPTKIAGSEITNESAYVYMPDGKTPANGANISVIPVGYIPEKSDFTKENTKIFKTMTNSLGLFTVSGISNGLYNIIAQKDTLSSFQDSIFFGDSSTLRNDTLNTTGSLTARILVQPNHNPQTAFIQVMGTTSYFTNVDSFGNFTLSNLPKGQYQLRIITILPDYTPTFSNVQIRSGKNDTLRTPIKLIFTGIPVINGLNATYNPVTSIVTLKWDNVSYSNFNDFLIYRGTTDLTNNTMSLISSVKSPVFYDTISNLTIDTSTTHVLKLRYQIAVRTKSLINGDLSNASEVTVIFSPKLGKLLTSDTIYFTPNVPFTFTIAADSLLGTIAKYYYALSTNNQFIEMSKPETTITIAAPADSIIRDLFCVAKITTPEGIDISDTLYLQSQMVWDKVSMPFDVQNVGYYATVKDNKLFVFAENSKSVTLWSSIDGTNWLKTSDSLPFNSMVKQPLVFKGEFDILQRDLAHTNATLWTSADGAQWTSAQIDSLPNSGYDTDYEVWSAVGDKIILMNYYPVCLKNNECYTKGTPNCWSTDDGLHWESISIPNSLFPDRLDIPNKNYIALERNGSLIVGGAWRSMYMLSPASKNYSFRVWESMQTEPVYLPFPQPIDSSMIAPYNPQAAIFKGNLFMSAQINMESSIDIAKNTKYLWELGEDNNWYLCSKTFPATNNAQMEHNYHALITFNNRLYSISNAGVWVARR